MAGLEVDSVTPAAGVFSGVVVARVLSTEQHPTPTSCVCARSAMARKLSRSCAVRQTCARA
jgi:phenylalanyl-tRNA synthetase beta chain